MPISKKPRSKTVVKTSPKAGAPAALPDRRAMESFLAAIAGHRDTFFRPLKDIKMNDRIRFTTPEGANEYRVVSTKIVGPKDTFVLENKSDDTLTLITCYPFYYVGPAPKRFIVEATKN
jgi:LPXTG-site transpeptidase (sortase) family protein